MLQSTDAFRTESASWFAPPLPSKWYLLPPFRLGRVDRRTSSKVYSVKCEVISNSNRGRRRGALNRSEEKEETLLCAQVTVGVDIGRGRAVVASSRAWSLLQRSHSILIVVAFRVALGCCPSRKLTTEAARCRRWCPQAQVPKLLEGTLIAISSRPTTALLAPGKLRA